MFNKSQNIRKTFYKPQIFPPVLNAKIKNQNSKQWLMRLNKNPIGDMFSILNRYKIKDYFTGAIEEPIFASKLERFTGDMILEYLINESGNGEFFLHFKEKCCKVNFTELQRQEIFKIPAFLLCDTIFSKNDIKNALNDVKISPSDKIKIRSSIERNPNISQNIAKYLNNSIAQVKNINQKQSVILDSLKNKNRAFCTKAEELSYHPKATDLTFFQRIQPIDDQYFNKKSNYNKNFTLQRRIQKTRNISDITQQFFSILPDSLQKLQEQITKLSTLFDNTLDRIKWIVDIQNNIDNGKLSSQSVQQTFDKVTKENLCYFGNQTNQEYEKKIDNMHRKIGDIFKSKCTTSDEIQKKCTDIKIEFARVLKELGRNIKQYMNVYCGTMHFIEKIILSKNPKVKNTELLATIYDSNEGPSSFIKSINYCVNSLKDPLCKNKYTDFYVNGYRDLASLPDDFLLNYLDKPKDLKCSFREEARERDYVAQHSSQYR